MSELIFDEPPGPEASRPKRGTISDRKQAARMLEIRARGGYAFGLYLRWSAPAYLILLAYLGFALVLCALAGILLLFSFTLTFFAGWLLRDLQMYSAQRKVWPFSERVTNWDLIEQIANEP